MAQTHGTDKTTHGKGKPESGKTNPETKMAKQDMAKGDLATIGQLNTLSKLCKELNLNAPSTDMTRMDADKRIEELRAKLGKH